MSSPGRPKSEYRSAQHEGTRVSLTGFKVIDEKRFAQLPDETFLQWRRKGWLPLAYSHFFSIGACRR